MKIMTQINTLKRFFISDGSNSQKTIKSSFLVFSFRFIDQLFRITRTIVLAWLLSPNDFGIFGVVLILLSVLDSFSQTGFLHALIQKDGDIKSYLNVAFTVQFFRGIILALILFFSSGLISSFFNISHAEAIFKAISIGIFIQGITNVAAIYLEKDLKFHKYFAYQFLGTIVDFVFALTFAFLLKNVWALVVGYIFGSLSRVIASYFVVPYLPKIDFNFKKIKELTKFGKWISFSNMIGFFILQGDNLFVGKILGVNSLGFYQMAYRISNMPSTEIVNALSPVIFPAYSKIQNNQEKLRESYLKVLTFLTFLSFPFAGLIFILAKEFTILFLGAKWLPITALIQISVVSGLIRSVAATTGPLFLAKGRPGIDTKLQALRFIVMIILIYPFVVLWGNMGAATAVLLSIAISGMGFFALAVKITECKWVDFIRSVAVPFLNTLIMVFSLFAVKYFLPINFFSFFLLVVLAAIIYILCAKIFDNFLKYKISAILKESLILIKK